MTNLTEQWKNGELEERQYFVRMTISDIVNKADYFCGEFYTIDEDYVFDDSEISEVLAPVPSYLQWNAMLESNDSLVQTINALKNRLVEVAEENAKLKETIKRTKANGNYPSRVSAYKSRIATLCEKNQKLKELLSKCVSRVDTLSDILDFLKDKVVYKQSKQLADILKSTRDIIKEIDEVLK